MCDVTTVLCCCELLSTVRRPCRYSFRLADIICVPLTYAKCLRFLCESTCQSTRLHSWGVRKHRLRINKCITLSGLLPSACMCPPRICCRCLYMADLNKAFRAGVFVSHFNGSLQMVLHSASHTCLIKFKVVRRFCIDTSPCNVYQFSVTFQLVAGRN